MPPFLPPRSNHSNQIHANTTILPGFLHTTSSSSENQLLGEEGVLINTDPYLAGFLDGLVAASASANRNIPEASASLPFDNPNTPALVESTLQPYLLHRASSPCSFQPQGFSSDDPPREWPAILPDLLPEITDSGVYNDLLELNSLTSTAYPPPLDKHIWSQGSNGAVTLLASPPALTTEGEIPRERHLLPDLDGSQLNGQALSELRSLAPVMTEGHHASPPGSGTHTDQPTDVVNTHALPTTEVGALFQIGIPFDASTGARQEASLDELDLSFNASPSHATRLPEHHKHSVKSSPPVVVSRVAKDAVQTVFRAYGSKRSKFNEQSRISTALTRKIGACATCRKKKLRCDQSSKEKFVPCGRCVRLPPHLLNGPCCRIELIDIKLFRLGSMANPAVLEQWTLSKECGKGTFLLEDGTMAFEPPRQVYLRQEINMAGFAVPVSRFQPGPDDATAYVWTDAAGTKREYRLPTYYISDMAEAGVNMRGYCRRAWEEYPRTLLVNSNPIVRKTFKEAERYCKASKSDLVATALMFWSATRMIERFWFICGTDLLGVSPMEHDIGPCRRHPSVAAITVTPVMDTQLDELAIGGLLVPLAAKLLRQLKERTLAKKKEYWYEIYLATFVVLHNSEQILDHVVDYARRFCISAEPKSNDEASLSHAYYHACKTILAYFHFASGGASPLTLDWLDRAQDTSLMTQHQIEYLRDMQAEILHQDTQLQALKGASMYETEMYWCHQMLFSGWKADMPHRGRLLEFTEKDFLVS